MMEQDGPSQGSAAVRHGRVPWPLPSELDERQEVVRESIVGGPRSGERAFALTDAEGRMEGPFNLMLLAPGPGLALSELGAALRFRTTLSDRVREIVILTQAVLDRSSFEWYAHEAVARRIGMTEDEIAAVRELRAPESFAEGERVAQQAVRDMVASGDLGDEVFERLESCFGPEGVVELILVTGYYATLSLAMRVLRTPLPAGVEDPLGPLAE
jgi:4-carboxymuconolactone decarboxylase